MATSKPDAVSSRNWEMYQHRVAGASLRQIGNEFGVTKERVRQIVLGVERHARHEGRWSDGTP
jgi:DNA-directed RNA polymerase sigma subunit (sigma70/sigma32)